jgi:hypothetical protein
MGALHSAHFQTPITSSHFKYTPCLFSIEDSNKRNNCNNSSFKLSMTSKLLPLALTKVKPTPIPKEHRIDNSNIGEVI